MGKKFDSNQCKVNLKLAINRLKLQKNKKDNLIKNQKREIAELLRSAKDESARIKVESVIREDFIIEAYEILELFCELLLARLGVIEIAKECPPDLREAVCTVIYAAPRTDIKELAIVRELLYVKFGKELAMDAMNNKDNCVNARVVHKLAVQTPENYLVFQYLNEIAKAHNVDWKAEFTTPDATPALTSVPAMTSTPLFPEPPKSVHASSPTPNANQVMFPSVPSGFASPAPMFPSVPPSVAPTSIPSFPDVPQVNSTPSVPVPNFNFSVPGVNNDIPSGPSFSFPTPPNVGPSANNVPTFPDVPTFPSVPSNNSVATNQSHPEITNPPLDFPSPPKDDNSSGIPDFDDLTARFEKLKRRDL